MTEIKRERGETGERERDPTFRTLRNRLFLELFIFIIGVENALSMIPKQSWSD